MLFFYDIFWVFLSKHIFGKNVMVAVATGLDVPMKIQIPLLHHTSPSGQVQHCNKRARTVSAVGRVCARACACTCAFVLVGPHAFGAALWANPCSAHSRVP